jgi:hypothetical protein
MRVRYTQPIDPETRERLKIRKGDVFTFGGRRYIALECGMRYIRAFAEGESPAKLALIKTAMATKVLEEVKP